MKFKVGDKIKGNHPTHYGITTDKWTGNVLEVLEGNRIKVDGCYGPHVVNTQYFDLVEAKSPIYSIY